MELIKKYVIINNDSKIKRKNKFLDVKESDVDE
jgi:hypothetical protein